MQTHLTSALVLMTGLTFGCGGVKLPKPVAAPQAAVAPGGGVNMLDAKEQDGPDPGTGDQGGDAAAAPFLPQASWSGTGTWAADGFTGEYTVDTTITGDHVVTHYVSPEETINYPARWHFSSGGTFVLNVDGVDQPIGNGKCAAKACQYSAPAVMETQEQWTFTDAGLTRTGSRVENGANVTWTETLTPGTQPATTGAP